MALRFYDSKGKLRSVSMFDVLLNPAKLRAQFEAEKKQREEEKKKLDTAPQPVTESSAQTTEDKPEAPAPAPAPDPAPAAGAVAAPVKDDTVDFEAVLDLDDVDVLLRVEKALQDQLIVIKARKAEAYRKKKAEGSSDVNPAADIPKEEKGKGKAEGEPTQKPTGNQPNNAKKTKAEKKAEKKAAKEGTKKSPEEDNYKMPMFDDADHSDTDPNVPGIESSSEDFTTGYEPPEDRPNLTMYQCAQIMRLHEYYDYMKYLAIASKFYDLNRIRITPEEMADILRCVTNPTSPASAPNSGGGPFSGFGPSTAPAAKEDRFSSFLFAEPLKRRE